MVCFEPTPNRLVHNVGKLCAAEALIILDDNREREAFLFCQYDQRLRAIFSSKRQTVYK